METPKTIRELHTQDEELNNEYRKQLVATKDTETFKKRMEEKTQRFRDQLYRLMNEKGTN